MADTGLAAGLERCKQPDWCEHLLCGQTGVTARPGEGCEGQKGSLQDTVWVVFSETPFKLNRGLGLWGLNCDEDDPGAEVKVWEVGGVLDLLALASTALGSCFLCRSVTSWADSWSSTYITWVPTSKLIYIGERPDRKSLTYTRNQTL